MDTLKEAIKDALEAAEESGILPLRGEEKRENAVMFAAGLCQYMALFCERFGLHEEAKVFKETENVLTEVGRAVCVARVMRSPQADAETVAVPLIGKN